ncbi:wHTH domain-containing protein [Thiocapsa marina]|uniref:wHTH domain-containing protein n=1 Tax=Thiocapsa marina TaxID=244573 RepID=UPI0002D7BC4A|nr:hypothetical protein [Thiocapsa marina]
MLALADTCADGIGRKLLSQDIDALNPRLEPKSPIADDRIAKAANQLKRPPQAIRERYERLAKQFDRKLE